MRTAGLGFWRHLIDIPLIIFRRVIQIIFDLYPLFVLLSTLVGMAAGFFGGTVGGAILTFMAGGTGAAVGAPVGAAAGAGAGLGFALGVGEGLLVVYIVVEAASLLKAWIDLGAVEQTESEQIEDLIQMATSAIGLGIAIVLITLSAIGGAIARGLKLKLTPGGAAQRFFAGLRRGLRGGSRFNPWRRLRGRGRTAEPRVIEVESPARLRASEPVYQYGRWTWTLYDVESGAVFCDVYVEVPSASARPTGGPRLTLTPKTAVLPDGTIVRLEAKGFSWTPESLRLAIEAFQRKFGFRPLELGGEIDWANLANFQWEFSEIRAANPGMSVDAIGAEAAKRISFGTHRTTVGYGDLRARVSNFGDETVTRRINGEMRNVQLHDVPKDVYIEARPTSSGGSPGGTTQ